MERLTYQKAQFTQISLEQKMEKMALQDILKMEKMVPKGKMVKRDKMAATVEMGEQVFGGTAETVVIMEIAIKNKMK